MKPFHLLTELAEETRRNLSCRQEDRKHGAGASFSRGAADAQRTSVLVVHVLDNGEAHTVPCDALGRIEPQQNVMEIVTGDATTVVGEGHS